MSCIGDLDIHPCPYCNSSNLYIDEYGFKFRKGYCVTCYDCGMCGPVSFDGQSIAIKAWETLHRKMCRHCMDRLIRQNKKLHAEIKRLVEQVEIPVIFDKDRVIFRCENCGYIVECNFKDRVDLKDFLECVLAHECYVVGGNNGMD